MADPDSGRRRVCWALIFTACYSRHTFVWLTFAQTTEAVIAGCEAAWAFFDGVFRVLIPDNMATVVAKADPLNPRFNQAFVEYAQSRGFVIDPARVRPRRTSPGSKGSCTSPGIRCSPGRASSIWPTPTPRRGMVSGSGGAAHHGTTQCRPAELFALAEQPHCCPLRPRP